jgi:pimeloyl-ACP methyl ester carboxylesterase
VVRWQALDQANRIGSLFVNPGGPGGSGVEFLRTAPPGALDAFARFDVVSWDPRGVGASRPAVDCLTDDEQNAGAAGGRFVRPAEADKGALLRSAKEYVAKCVARNADIMPHLSTANTARDLDLLRAAVGDPKLNYIGLSYGTMIGATYASLFPGRTRAMLMDAPIDADVWANRPFDATREQAAGFEDSLRRFFTACAAGQGACGFGGTDPQNAFDDLVASMNREPLPAPGAVHHEPVTGDEVLVVALEFLYGKRNWPLLAGALRQAATGDASLFRDYADQLAGRRADGTWPPSGAFFATTAQDYRIDRDTGHYMDAGRHGHGLSPNFWWISGYYDLPYAVYPLPQRSTFRGPFTHSPSAPPMLVIAGTHDPATPYVWGERYVAQMGNARLLTYLNDLVLPAAGTVCVQRYDAFPPAAARSTAPAEWPLPRVH